MTIVTSLKAGWPSSIIDTPLGSPTDLSSVSSVVTDLMESEDSSSTEMDEDTDGQRTTRLKVEDDETYTPPKQVDGTLNGSYSLDSSKSPPKQVIQVQKKRRGRPPRKTVTSSPTKSPRGPFPRSKTGCKTCRLRKKKCDERKPGCELTPSNTYFKHISFQTLALLVLILGRRCLSKE